MNKHFLLCGGAGFIGRHLATALLKKPDTIVTVADVDTPHPTLRGRLEYVEADVRYPLTFEPARPVTTLVNLAAVHRTPGHDEHEYHETNEAGASNIVDFCRRQDVASVWFTSSIAVYGPSEEPRTERSPLAPNTAYGRSKLAAENTHSAWAMEDSERKLVTVRPGAVFGPGEAGNFTRLAHSLKAGYFFYPGRSDTIKACGFVEDLIRSLIFMDERGPGTHLYNYAYPDPYTVRDICNAFMRIGGFSAATPTVPHRLLLMASYITEIANSIGLRNDINRARVSKLLRSTNIVPEALTKAGFRFETNLESALRTWRAAEPAGSFV